jgi:hypothetical protein
VNRIDASSVLRSATKNSAMSASVAQSANSAIRLAIAPLIVNAHERAAVVGRAQYQDQQRQHERRCDAADRRPQQRVGRERDRIEQAAAEQEIRERAEQPTVRARCAGDAHGCVSIFPSQPGFRARPP